MPRGAHLTFGSTFISPYPPHACGGEGRGEEVPLSLALSPPALSEGRKLRGCAEVCKKVKCARATADFGKQLANLCGRNKVNKKARVVRGQQIKWEIPVYE
jgi:hypothetical protein